MQVISFCIEQRRTRQDHAGRIARRRRAASRRAAVFDRRGSSRFAPGMGRAPEGRRSAGRPGGAGTLGGGGHRSGAQRLHADGDRHGWRRYRRDHGSDAGVGRHAGAVSAVNARHRSGAADAGGADAARARLCADPQCLSARAVVTAGRCRSSAVAARRAGRSRPSCNAPTTSMRSVSGSA